jgi:hypothetical protein
MCDKEAKGIQMNDEVKGLLEDLFLGSIIVSGGTIEGLHCDDDDEGGIVLNIRYNSDDWQYIRVPEVNIQRLQDRLTSVPASVITGYPLIESEATRSKP